MDFFNKIKDVASSALSTDIFNSLSKELLIEKVTSLDYPAISKVIINLEQTSPSSQKLLPVMEVLELAAIEYNESESESKNDDYIDFLTSCIDAEQVINELEPIAGMIPAGSILIFILRQAISLKNR